MRKSSALKTFLAVFLLIWGGILLYSWLPDTLSGFFYPHGKSANSKGGHSLDKGTGGAREVKKSGAGGVPQWSVTDTVHVVICSDSNTVGGMVTLVNSIVSNTRSPVFFHLITDAETTPHLRTWLKQTKLRNINFEIREFPLDWVKGKIKVRGGRAELGNPLNYARYYLPDLLPTVRGRVVYIDDDCIVLGDIAELYHTPLKSGTIAAFSEDCRGINKRVSHMQNTFADFFDLKNKHFLDLDVDPHSCAFNTGVFVTNLTEWRQRGITQQLLYWLELNTKEELYGNEKGGGGSQPPMMLVFHNNYTPLDPLWHVRFLGWGASTSIYSQSYMHSAKLLHWNGHLKPWGRSASFQEIWDHFYLPDPTHRFTPLRRSPV